MSEIKIPCKYCGELLIIKSRIADREWSRHRSWYLSHTINKRCAAQHSPRMFWSKENLLDELFSDVGENDIPYDYGYEGDG